MKSPSSTPAEPTQIEQVCSMLLRLVMMLWMQQSPARRLFRQFQRRVDAIGERIAVLAANVQAGHTPKPRSRAPGRAAARGPRGESPFPKEYGWFAEQFGLYVGTDAGTLLAHIQTPEVQAQMAADPRIGDLFREILHACGLLEEAEPFLPPSRAERARLERTRLERTRLEHDAEPPVDPEYIQSAPSTDRDRVQSGGPADAEHVHSSPSTELEPKPEQIRSASPDLSERPTPCHIDTAPARPEPADEQDGEVDLSAQQVHDSATLSPRLAAKSQPRIWKRHRPPIPIT